jgi:RHS repeat-associated protein
VGQGYHGYGKYRLGNVLPTDHRFTGQKLDATGLMYYGARYYDRHIGVFVSPDTLVPDPTNVWDYNRFAYARLNPLKYNDPTGHEPKQPCCITGGPSLAPKVLQLIVDLAEVVWDGTSSERSTAGEVLDVALHHPLFGPSVDEISAVHEYAVRTYIDPHLPESLVTARDTATAVINTPCVADILLGTVQVAPGLINFSQRSVNSNVLDYIEDMANGRWDWSRSGPLRVMEVDGQLVTYDNRRLLAAQHVNLESVPVQIVNADDIVPGSNKTWSRAFEIRRNDVRNLRLGGPVPRQGLKEKPLIEQRRPR